MSKPVRPRHYLRLGTACHTPPRPSRQTGKTRVLTRGSRSNDGNGWKTEQNRPLTRRQSSGAEARWWAGQWLPACQPFRAAWQMAIRPFTPFPPPPPKFRTAGFPQYGFKQAVSRDLHGPSHLYATTVEVLTTRVYSVVGLLVQAAREASDTTHPSSGPWLRQRLFCPPASSLTMATSEPLTLRCGLWFMPAAF